MERTAWTSLGLEEPFRAGKQASLRGGNTMAGSRQCEAVTSAAFIHQTIVAGGTDTPPAPDIGARTKMTLIVASSSPLASHRAVLTLSG